jgi:hypothetical protein
MRDALKLKYESLRTERPVVSRNAVIERTIAVPSRHNRGATEDCRFESLEYTYSRTSTTPTTAAVDTLEKTNTVEISK